MSSTANHNCVYFCCPNNRRKNSDVSFFRFPVKDYERAKQWQKNCGNIKIAMMETSLLKNNKLICERHFFPNDYKSNSNRKLLKNSAVPQVYNAEGSSLSSTTLDNFGSMLATCGAKRKSCMESSDEEINFSEDISTPAVINLCMDETVASGISPRYCPSICSVQSDQSKLSERVLWMPSSPTKSVIKIRCNSYASKIKLLRNKLKAKRSEAYRLKKKSKKFSASEVISNLMKYKSSAVKTLINMQLFHRRCQKWTHAEKQLALSLYYKSPGAYRFMLGNLKFTLPSIRTIQSWQKVINLKPGVKTNLTGKLALKAKSMTEREKMCVVLFDEIALKRKLEFHQGEDIIEGFQDLGTLGREPKLANTALVFLIRGLLHNWKIPFGYFVSAGPVNSTNLQIVVKNVITALQKLSFLPKVLVCDQGSNNRRAIKSLGATKDNPVVEIEGQTLFSIFDAPHLIKSLRNNFMNKKLEFKVEGKLVRWYDVKETYDIDQKSTSTRAMLKLTPVHILPNTFQKMRVKYAVQIFSNSVAAAIKTAAATNELKSPTALDTAEFIQFINNIFDCLNSKTLSEPNRFKKPLSIYNKTSIETLKRGITYFENIEVFESGKKRNNIYCIEGFAWTLRSIGMLWASLQDVGVKYLITSFLNQDPLENFFSVVRNRGGYNPTPTVRQFRIAMQQNMNIRLQMATNEGNCLAADTEMLEIEQLETRISTILEKNELTENDAIASTEISVENKETIPSNINYSIKKPISLEQCSNVYVAGFLLFRVIEKYNCSECLKFLNEEVLGDPKELLILYRDYCPEGIAYLKRPKDSFVSIVQLFLEEFQQAFEIYKCAANVSKKIKIHLSNSLIKNMPWYNFDSNDKCFDHKRFILNLFVKMKMFRHLKWISDRPSCDLTKKKTVKPHKKMKTFASSK